MERPVPVIDPRTDEIRQHVIAVGRADQLPYRQAHPLGIVTGQDIEGGNVDVCAVKGNFDDAQDGVKAAFSNETLRDSCSIYSRTSSSLPPLMSNSSRSRLLEIRMSIDGDMVVWKGLPQVVYYISAYCDLLNAKEIKLGQPVNYCVPTGNFGNILACYYAKRMGLPVDVLKRAGRPVPQLQAPGPLIHLAQGGHLGVAEFFRAIGGGN